MKISESESYDRIYEFMSPYIVLVQHELEKLFSKDSSYHLSAFSETVIKSGGKRFRPLLTLLACEAVKGDYRKAISISAATELAHTVSIIQDDIIDKATLRRGVKPIHVVFGVPTAILVSDYLFLKMVESILKVAELDANSHKLVVNILNIVVRAGIEAVEGEYLDSKLGEKENITVGECISVAEKKTGTLMEAALECGALIGGGSPEEVNALKNYGAKLGVAYQVVDDLLGLVGSVKLVGKDTELDVRAKRMNVVIAHSLQNSTSQACREVFEALKTEANHDLLKLLNKTNSIKFAEQLAMEYAEKSIDELKLLKPTKAKIILENIPKIIVNRRW